METKCTQPKGKGQSVVELAVMLPILLIIVVGLVELGSVLFTQMTVTNAAREGTRFGVAGGNDDDITTVVSSTLSSILSYDGQNANVYVIRGLTGDDGKFDTSTDDLDADSYWYVRHTISGTSPSQPVSPTVIEQSLNTPNAKIVIAQAFYDHESLLGLPFVDFLAGQAFLSSYTVMRMESPGVRQEGCMVLPIALHVSTITDECTEDADHDGHCEMNDIMSGVAPGNFGWLRWSSSQSQGSAGDLADMLSDPTLSLSTYQNPMDESDTTLNAGDWVWGNTGVSASSQVRDALDDLVGRQVRVPVWDIAGETPGIGARYHIVGFALVSITDWDFPNLDWISAELIAYPDDSCS
jgi:hypothetical protein